VTKLAADVPATVARIVDCPIPTPVTKPVPAATVATFGLRLRHVAETLLTTFPLGARPATENSCVPPCAVVDAPVGGVTQQVVSGASGRGAGGVPRLS